MDSVNHARQMVDRFQTDSQAGQPDVEKQAAGAVGRDRRQEGLARLMGGRGDVHRAQKRGERRAQRWAVVDNMDEGGAFMAVAFCPNSRPNSRRDRA